MPPAPQNPSLSGLQSIGSGSLHKARIGPMLDGTPMFGDLEWAEIEAFVDYVKVYRAQAGTVIFREGDKGGSLAVVLEGRVDVFKIGSDGTPKNLSSIGPGRSFGEMAIVDGEPRSATAMAAVPTMLLVLTRPDFERLVDEQPKLAAKFTLKLARLLSQRLRQVSGALVEHLGQR